MTINGPIRMLNILDIIYGASKYTILYPGVPVMSLQENAFRWT